MSPDPQWKAQLQGFHELQGKIGLKVGLPSPFSGFFFKFSEHTTSSPQTKIVNRSSTLPKQLGTQMNVINMQHMGSKPAQLSLNNRP
jgi:hypothetical protein